MVDAKTKKQALSSMKAKERAMAQRIDALVESGELQLEDVEYGKQQQGCGGKFFCVRVGKKRRAAASKVGASDAVDHQQARAASGGGSGSAATAKTEGSRIFGKVKSKVSAAEKLNHAAESMQAHVDQLAERARAARAKAQELNASGKRNEALAALKRAKTLEKQLEGATATHAALEQQVDVLAESELQKEVASALSATVEVTKKKTKGLLGKAEHAVDGAVELKDIADDLAQTLGGLQTEVYDDDELLEELESMMTPVDAPAASEAANKPPASGIFASTAPTSSGIIDPANYPNVPQKKLERRKLLEDDSAAAVQEE